ncbi:DUF1667 domain-containing protein [Stecheria intestinalis]|uniref:DUF1667 domain-containing protein n=1 Tax=Stecheria intestinalis TaxID=2606630 RepID=UPI0023F57174|nr:DUF1667 domain-containing protein [Stecheria intestinalis]MDD5881299.1 DUF1667 domain-containing protein [Stecheria intestinalis]
MKERKMTCIVCPNGCALTVREENGAIMVEGNKCPRGKAFGESEIICPMRTICTTVRTIFPEVPVLPVRVSCEIPKEKIFDVMKEINRVTVTERLGTGDPVIRNVLGLNADVIVTSSILKEG